ncbi:MAG: sodium-dependent transporter [Treponema sp.]|nr:sodium-dependent transporter [Treponema sp.]
MENGKIERNSFTGSIGFVLAAAGSAVGLGNIWRFPYCAAKDGGGLFLLIYLIFALTFGFALLITEVAMGRKTLQGPLTAYKFLNKKWRWLGIFSFVVPFIIYPYYCVIGGWVIKYMVTYISGRGAVAVQDGFFDSFISGNWQPLLFTFIFAGACFYIVYKGVEDGIEKFSKILMPILAVILIFIAIYSLFLKYTDAEGVTRTGLQGAKIYLVPSFKGITVKGFMRICLDAIGQLFYSLSIAMGIMITYGSYMKKEVKLEKSVNQIIAFDTGIALLAGLMIIPTVFVFSGMEGLNSAGPSLIFVALPKIFNSLGIFGHILGALFFIMVLFAAITSAVSILEAITSSLIDKFGWSRKKSVLIMSGATFIVSLIVCFGYNIFYFSITLPTGSKGLILDILDYASMNVLMPIIGIFTCVLVGWVCKPKTIIDEITFNGEKFGRAGLYSIMIKFIAPILLFVILLTGLGLI